MHANSNNTPSIGDLLLATLASARNTRRFRSLLRDRKIKKYKDKTLRVTLSRLKEKGYITKSSNGWLITNKGKDRISREELYGYFPSPFLKDAASNTIISFDIPERSRVLRNWLRNQIKIFGYKMLQQSLWIGPGPLPPYFLKRLVNLKIKENVRIFKVTIKA